MLTVGKCPCLFVLLGLENILGVGLDICIALTELGVRNGGRLSTLLGVRIVASGSAVGRYDVPLGILDIGSSSPSASWLEAASSPTAGEVSNFWNKSSAGLCP